MKTESSNERQNIEALLQDPELSQSLLSRALGFFEQALTEAFRSRRDVFIFEMVKKLRREQLSQQAAVPEGAEQGGWVDVESLSRLRNVVGGRFENIKKKWVGAGFPLREHRGDKVKDFEIDTEGWVELSNWMSKHGFESRLRPDRAECLFQIKALPKPK